MILVKNTLQGEIRVTTPCHNKGKISRPLQASLVWLVGSDPEPPRLDLGVHYLEISTGLSKPFEHFAYSMQKWMGKVYFNTCVN